MKKELIQKQIAFINPLLCNQRIEEVIILDAYNFIVKITPSKYLVICQKAPHIGIAFFENQPEFKHLETMLHKKEISLKDLSFKGLNFNEKEGVIHLYLDKKTIVFEMKHCGNRRLDGFKNDSLAIATTVLLTQQEQDLLEKYKDKLLAYLFKEVRLHFLKIQKQIDIFKKDLAAIPLLVDKHQENLLFILERQKEIEARDKQFLDLFKKHEINFLLPYGVILKKAYKLIHKLEKQKQVLPKLISIYEEKLKQPYFVAPIKTDLEKLEKKQARVFFTTSHEKIKVARSDKDADILTFKQAHGNHYWFHVDSYPGAHVLIFSSKPTEEAFIIARFLAKHYSKAKTLPVCEVIQTQVKFLKKGKKAGEVTVGKKNVVEVKHDIFLEKKLFSQIDL